MEANSNIPSSHTLWSPHDTVKDAAESLGVTLPDEAAKNLAMDVEYRIHEILETAVKFMRHSKRRLLMTSDINHALEMLNIEPLYGYDNTQQLNFKETLVGAGGQTLYYIDDKEMDLEKLINQPLPTVPRQTTFTAHWLAVEGVQPMIPQNPLPSEIKSIPPFARGATSSTLGNDITNSGLSSDVTIKDRDDQSRNKNSSLSQNASEVKPLVKHVLSKELKLYFDKVVEVLISTDPEKENLKYAALTSLKNDPGLHQLVPYFIQFVAEQITNQLRNIEILTTMLEVISALADNKTLFLDPYVHTLMPCILTLQLAKRIGPTSKDDESSEAEDSLKKQLAVREFAAILLDHIIKVYGSSYSTLKARVTRTLLRALLDYSKPVGTHYGTLLGLKNMGPEVIKLVVIGNLKIWYKQVIEDSNKTDYEINILLNTILDIFRHIKVEVDNSENNSDGEQSVSEDVKFNLEERVGAKLAELILEQQDAVAIARGIFFGEINI
ncbi:Piso0_002770 [Millerozyma farinosa CBS 7064]|uniref:TBP-associated factor 6 n=1 Tax=Pichia sorbitophila (strain ATCC MYA-4447 / BCRC 22081 / CBS 7064 / NBRC 10061 / NRRL Y-12695) TaxID=559304 RepID=G8YDG6_PICSO|nr:Piso0_002770 [Millerozyma farinosa CBS 7064]